MDNIRVLYCVIYSLIGIVLLVGFCIMKCPNLKKLLTDNLPNILWCLGWASVGIGVGLWNDRNNTAPQTLNHIHYFTYFFFVLFIGSLAAFAVFRPKGGLQSYAASALAALAIGFTGDALAGIILHLSGLK